MFLIYRWRTAVLAAWSINGKGMRAQEPTACWRKSVFGAEVSWESNFGWIHSPPICTCRIQQQQMAEMVFLLMHFVIYFFPFLTVATCASFVLSDDFEYRASIYHFSGTSNVKYNKLIYFLPRETQTNGLICLLNMTF